jgi:gas vesicle protein
MAFAPGAGVTRTPSRAQGRPQTNGRPRSKAPTAAAGNRPSVTFMAGLGIGLAIGAAAALLLAPNSGAQTRQSLRNRGRKIGNRARDAWEDLRIEMEATRRALRRKRRDAKVEIEEERTMDGGR